MRSRSFSSRKSISSLRRAWSFVRIVSRNTATTSPTEPAYDSEQVAQTDPAAPGYQAESTVGVDETADDDALPATASKLPLLALIGLLACAGAVALRRVA